MTGTLIVALDVDSRREAESLVSALDGTADFFKIGSRMMLLSFLILMAVSTLYWPQLGG